MSEQDIEKAMAVLADENLCMACGLPTEFLICSECSAKWSGGLRICPVCFHSYTGFHTCPPYRIATTVTSNTIPDPKAVWTISNVYLTSSSTSSFKLTGTIE